MGLSVAIQVITVLIVQVAAWYTPGPDGEPVQFGVTVPADHTSASVVAAARRRFRTGVAAATAVALPVAVYAEATGMPLVGLLTVLTMAGADWMLYDRARAMVARATGHEARHGHSDDSRWRGGLLYVNRDDSRLFVPKRVGFGWTFNFAHPVAWLLLAALVAAPIISAILGAYLR